MDHAYQANVSQTKPSLAGYQLGYPQPASGSSPATIPGPGAWFALVEEVRNAIVAAGIVPDAQNLTQLSQAISQVGGQAGAAAAAPFAANIETALNQSTTALNASTMAQTAAGLATAAISALAGLNGSSEVGFIQLGVGSILRAVQGKLRDYVSVLDFYANGFNGPMCDPTGTIDSTLGIQAALNAAKNVYVPPGTYKTTAPLNVPANCNLFGAGKGITTIKPTGTFAACISCIGPSFNGYASFVYVGAMSIDGSAFTASGAATGTGAGLYIKYIALRAHFYDLYIFGVGGKGIYIEGSFDHQYSRIEVRACTGLGVHNYEKQVADGVYEECSKLVFHDIWALENNAGGLQWQIDGGDNFVLNDCKPSEGSIGLQIGKNGFGHKIRNLMFDSLSTPGIALQLTTNFTQQIFVDGMFCNNAAIGVDVVRGQNIQVNNVFMNGTGGVGVQAGSGADGAIYLGPAVTFSDLRAIPMTYPRYHEATWAPSFSGSGSALGNGTLTGSYVLYGKDVRFIIKLTMGSTTTMGYGAGFSLPPGMFAAIDNPIIATAFDSSAATAYATQASTASGITSIQVGAGYLGTNTPFVWATNDTLTITGAYQRS